MDLVTQNMPLLPHLSLYITTTHPLKIHLTKLTNDCSFLSFLLVTAASPSLMRISPISSLSSSLNTSVTYSY